MLDTARQVMTRVPGPVASGFVGDISFAPDGALVLVLWQPDIVAGKYIYEIYSQGGAHIAQCEDPELARIGWEQPSIAHFMGHRVAIAHPANFAVRDLRSGQVLATIWPAHVDGSPSITGSGVIAADRNGSRLAYCAAGTSVLQIYDSATLNLLGCVSAVGAPVCARGDYGAYIVWGLHGWILVTDSSVLNEIARQDLHVLAIQEGGSTYEQVLWRDYQPTGPPAVSPDGALVGIVARDKTTIEVHDTRFGLPLCRHAVPPLPNSPERLSLFVEMLWSNSGDRLLVGVHGFNKRQDWAKEQILVLHF